MSATDYTVTVEPLSDQDGGGYVAYVPELPGCMSDGDTPTDAVLNAYDAIEEWVNHAQSTGRDIPGPQRHRECA